LVRILSSVVSESRGRRIEQVIRNRLCSVTVVLENLHDPHNGAAVIRSCEAMGLLHLHVVGDRRPFFCSSKVTQNAHKWINIYRHDSIRSCLEFLGQAGFTCWAALPPMKRRTRGGEVGADRPVALLFGNEHDGLSPEALEGCAGRFSIPMWGFSESLNLSVSVALSLHDVVLRRRRALGRQGDLPREARSQLRAAYYSMSTRHAVPVVCRHLGIRFRPGRELPDAAE
jgi:tRNA (guanosine-2'-O-)-methyltransferase